MTTDELIKALRAWYIALLNSGKYKPLAMDILAAADRLEELDERVSIMGDGACVTTWDNPRGGEQGV